MLKRRNSISPNYSYAYWCYTLTGRASANLLTLWVTKGVSSNSYTRCPDPVVEMAKIPFEEWNPGDIVMPDGVEAAFKIR